MANQKGKYVYDWPRPMVTTDAAVFCFSRGKAKLLLIQRGRPPFKGQWALPGGFVDMDEELADAAVRELAEETGLYGVTLQQLHTFGTIGRDPRGRQITTVYWGIAEKNNTKVQGGDDAAAARWFDIDQLPEHMAFDHHEIACFAIGRFKRTRRYREHVRNR